LLIIGAGNLGYKFSESIANKVHFGYNVIGFLDDEPKPYLDGKYLGNIDELNKVLSSKHVDDVIIALPNYAEEKFDGVLKICEKHTTRVKILPDYHKFISSKFGVSMFGQYPIISVRKEPINEIYWRALKRVFDFVFSLVLLVTVLWWFGGIIALIIKFTSKGPVFFKQERWGRNNKKFITLKFRSMVGHSKDLDENGKYRQATKDDPRITKIGKYLRKTNLDELPQFWNVLKGDMSVIGPRPHPVPLNLESKEVVHMYMLRTLVKPGISGWAQVNGYRGETKELELMQKRVDFDLWYIENWTFMLDMKIILLTIFTMVKGDPKAV
jgi:putative colanic acid biosynthesis UDP-glucose lipid carrier transferase